MMNGKTADNENLPGGGREELPDELLEKVVGGVSRPTDDIYKIIYGEAFKKTEEDKAAKDYRK